MTDQQYDRQEAEPSPFEDAIRAEIGRNAIDWAALAPGDPDPEPFADGVSCNEFIREVHSGAQFDCTRSPHDDPHHVSCAYDGATQRAEDSFVVAAWRDDAGGMPEIVEIVPMDHPRVRAMVEGRNR